MHYTCEKLSRGCWPLGLRWNHGTPDFANTLLLEATNMKSAPSGKWAGYASGSIFTARRSYASAVKSFFGSRNSVCPSVRLSVTRALWLIQRTYRLYFLYQMKGQSFYCSFLSPNSGWWATSLITFNGRSKWPTPSKIAHVDRFPPVTSQQ